MVSALKVLERPTVVKEATAEPITVLVVEDDPDTQEVLRDYLLMQGYAATGVATAREALAFLHKGQGAAAAAVIVLMDIDLPDGNGIDLCRQMEDEIWQFLHVVFLSGHDTVETRTAAYHAGAQAYLAKPVDLKELSACLGAASNNVHKHLKTLRDATGLLNLVVFEEMVERELEKAGRRGRRTSLLFVDVDRFKLVNDTCGHNIGTEVLRVIALRLERSLRFTALVSRMGDEFLALLPKTPLRAALIAAERVRGAVSAEPVLVSPTLQLPITVSIGVAVLDGNKVDFAHLHDSWLELKGAADTQLYEAKARGRNCVWPNLKPPTLR